VMALLIVAKFQKVEKKEAMNRAKWKGRANERKKCDR
jgi:hypothetical protein